MGLFSRLMGKGNTSSDQPDVEPVDFEGFTIKPAPLKQSGNFVTAGYIQKTDDNGVMQEHYFIRADTHSDFQSACQHAVFKARQIIRESGERLFNKS